ncbi:MAG: 1-acyl-sn-glycerol-3-phosphate acyltransferase [Bacteroidaceae bacterium]|nr:1-acyl-sn-glycerol-3-phosphate acyltransferase [Bacteroidaceae bacterium]
MRKILHPFYILYQICFAWWATLIITAITAIIIWIFGGVLKIKNMDYYPAWIWCRLTCLIFLIPVKVVDREKYVEKGKNYIFVANHQGMFDIFILYAFINKNFKWMMKDSLRKVPLLGIACEKTDHIYINRSTPQKDILRKSLKVLKEGKSMTIFAEGTRSDNGRLGRFKKGAFAVANLSQKPIVPIAIEGAYDILPKNCKVAHWSPVTVTFHKPIECIGRNSDNVDYLLDETRAAIAKTLGEEHINIRQTADKDENLNHN